MADPIKFTDGESVEWTLLVERPTGPPRNATPEDLARAGYEVPLTIRGHIELLQSLGYHVENPDSCVSEIAAHRALEWRIREEGVAWCERHQLSELLKAVDEARKP